MCGIAGIISRSTIEPGEIEGMTDSLAHRGPDARGILLEDRVALGHRRLSIIDLDPRSNQPFVSQDGRYVMVYNGEIFNFKNVAAELAGMGVILRTTSDTEVVLEGFAKWGVGVVHKLNGMFAFAIYDRVARRLYLFRDRVGKKPLYYWLGERGFLFASEIKAILNHSEFRGAAQVDPSTISMFLQLGFIPEPKTFFKGILKFPAGHYGVMEIDGPISILPYWQASHYITTARWIREPDVFRQLKSLVTDSVHSRLVSDVPVGLFLSGGIDSSLVAAVAAKATSLKSFSIGFEDSKFDESKYAERVAKVIGTEHHAYTLREREAVELVEDYLDHFDEPFADTSSIPTMLVSKMARQHVTVALTGDGGDELFLGYGSYTWANRLGHPMWKWMRPVIKLLLENAGNSRLHRISHMFDRVVTTKPRRHIFSQEQYFFSEAELSDGFFQSSETYSDWPYDDVRYLAVLSEAERQALFDFQFYLRDDLLVKVDRASMYYGLECRSPLLDHRLVEFSLNLPENMKKRGTVTKYLLKKMLYEMVPANLFDRPKWGFSVPLARWLQGDLAYLFDFLSKQRIEETGIFDPDKVANIKENFLKGDAYLYNRIWALIIIQRYLLKNGARK